METNHSKKVIYQDYYTDDDFHQITGLLPDLIQQAENQAADVMEPTIVERKNIMKSVMEFIKQKNRKVYGGTALNEIIKHNNPKDAFYDEYKFADVEFYSPEPVVDLVELCNKLHNEGYKHVVGQEADHNETYSIFSNFMLYCDITYVPARVYNGIQTITINNVDYTYPHFMLIDYLRMFNDPMNSARRWDKAFARKYLLLKYYPIEHYDKKIKLNIPNSTIKSLINQVKQDYIKKSDQNDIIMSGFDAYNFFINFASSNENNKMSRNTANTTHHIKSFMVDVSYIEVVSLNYKKTVVEVYDFLKKVVDDKSLLSLDEYFPLFQFTNYITAIKYKNETIIKIHQCDGLCIPQLKTTSGFMYVTYQYLLMTMFINKFRSHLDKDKEMYFNYSTAISNLVKTRNIYLTNHNLPVINSTPFGEFKIKCIGATVSLKRTSFLKKTANILRGKAASFKYEPAKFLKKTDIEKAKFDPKKYKFKNTSGNKILNQKNLTFNISKENNISIIDSSIDNVPVEHIKYDVSDDNSSSSSDR